MQQPSVIPSTAVTSAFDLFDISEQDVEIATLSKPDAATHPPTTDEEDFRSSSPRCKRSHSSIDDDLEAEGEVKRRRKRPASVKMVGDGSRRMAQRFEEEVSISFPSRIQSVHITCMIASPPQVQVCLGRCSGWPQHHPAWNEESCCSSIF